MGGEDSLRVVVRARPMNAREAREGARRCVEFYESSQQVVINGAATFAFDKVFSDTSDQATVYENSAAPLLDRIFDGFNGTVLAYGQTGSGKTYTMGTEDKDDTDEIQRGVIPRLVDGIFSRISAALNPDSFKVSVSMYEIYGDAVYDLLRSDKVKLEVRGDDQGCTIVNLTTAPVKDLLGALKQLTLGCHYRTKAETAMNATSSRSHAVFTILLEKFPDEANDASFSSKLQLVDLAGSERLKKTQAEGDRMKEGININSGLLAVGNVISALVQKQKHIPYRSSVLTRVLQDSLGGNAFTVMVACISPADTNSVESLNTLRYADRAKQIKNKPIINQNVKAEEISSLRAQIKQLQRELSQGRSNNAPDGFSASLSSELISLKEEVRKREEQLRDRGLKLADSLVKTNALNSKILRLEEEKERIREVFQQAWRTLENTDGVEPEKLLVKMKDSFESSKGIFEGSQIENCNETAGGEEAEDTIDDFDSARLAELQAQMERLDREIELKGADLLQSAQTQNQFNEDDVIREEEKAKLVARCNELESEISKLKSEQRKASTASKLAEERRLKLRELEKQHEEDKKKLNELRKLQEFRKKCEESQKKMEEELRQLKQMRVRLLREQQTEANKFKLFKSKHEKELQLMKTKQQRKEFEANRQQRQDQQRCAVLQQRLADANRANKALRELVLKRGNKKSAPKEAKGVQQMVEEELEDLAQSYHSQLLIDDLKQQRAELEQQYRSIDGFSINDRAAPSKRARYSLLENSTAEDEEEFEKEKKDKLEKIQNSIALLNSEIQDLLKSSTILEDTGSSAKVDKLASLNLSAESRETFDAILNLAKANVKKAVEMEFRVFKQKIRYEDRLAKKAETEKIKLAELAEMNDRYEMLAETIDKAKKNYSEHIGMLLLMRKDRIDGGCLQKLEELKEHFLNIEKDVKKTARRRTIHDGLTPKPELKRSDRSRKQRELYGTAIRYNDTEASFLVDKSRNHLDLPRDRVPLSPINPDNEDEEFGNENQNNTFVIPSKSSGSAEDLNTTFVISGASRSSSDEANLIPPLSVKSRKSALGNL
ncbi:unnamed protein product [Caenorhabditis auriculariae]|uniref:Kinesin motor domain-containing protein n=1 Tax=Caenorhabditis auriculariae TaxID=2777116 RepID=A0A8S1GMT6_9PELO|nr:unnamed protein product [Caenorhabditis auriculariae]